MISELLKYVVNLTFIPYQTLFFIYIFTNFFHFLSFIKRENEQGDIPKSIQCYMNETGASETEAREHVKSMIITVWKKMNKEAQTSSFSKSFIDTAINLGRMALCMYMHGDGHTIQDPDIKNRIMSLIFQSVPITSAQHVMNRGLSSKDHFERESNVLESLASMEE